jgi:hypothetical protein
VPEWKLNAAVLDGLRVLIVPSAEVFPEEDSATLAAWTRRGGTLIIAGECGRRLGESGNFDIAPHGSTLSPLYGMDRVVRLPKDPGFDFYRASEQRPGLLPGIAKILASAYPAMHVIDAPEVSWKVGLTPYRADDRFFVDVNNTDLDLAADTLTPSAPLRFSLKVPAALHAAKWKARVLAPGEPPAVEIQASDTGRLEILLAPVSVFASVVLDKE